MKKIIKKIIKSRMQGFTLIELLVVIAMFAATSTVILSILFVTLRASSKSDKLIILKQSGNAIMSQVVKQIRYAKSLDTPSSCPVTPDVTLSSIKITSVLDNGQTTFSCVDLSPGPPMRPATIASNSSSLVDTNSVSVTQCSFSCYQTTPNDPPTINFSFKLDAKSTTNAVESTGSIPFQSSVTMRNSNK